ncbi:MAG TPA: class I SAM-dependent methyltransferase [Acidimicrobiales bacterium]|nr:class I SAM-dependent methyltransferase [Acidimicrobiales bacterium]
MPTAVSAAPGGANSFAQRLFSPLPERYDRLAEVLSFGQNGRWRRAMVDHVVGTAPELVLDVATGPAGVALQLAARTGARVVGVDVTESMVRRARDNVERAGARIQLVLGRGEQLPFADGTFDAVTFTYLLRYVDDPAAAIRELTRVVRPGGVVASLEFLVPSRAFWRFWWWGYTRAVLPLAGWVTGGREWFDVGRFLGPNISSHYRRYPVSWTIGAWRDAGMVDVGARPMSLGGGLVMWGVRAGG